MVHAKRRIVSAVYGIGRLSRTQDTAHRYNLQGDCLGISDSRGSGHGQYAVAQTPSGPVTSQLSTWLMRIQLAALCITSAAAKIREDPPAAVLFGNRVSA